MRVEWLEDIIAVAETGSFHEAAERRNLTQSAFSRRIQSIEDYVGIALFDRTRKPVQLRPTTKEQHSEIIRLATELRRLITDLQRGDRLSGNKVVVVSQHALTASISPGLIEKFETHNPNAFVRLRSANLDECFGLLLSRQADIALAYRVPGEQHPIATPIIETKAFAMDRLVPVFAAGQRADLDERMEAGQLPIIAYPGSVFLGNALMGSILTRLPKGVRPVPRVETALTLAALELAAQGIGVAWVPESLSASRTTNGDVEDLSESFPSMSLEITGVRLIGPANHSAHLLWTSLPQDLGVSGLPVPEPDTDSSIA